MFWISWYFSFAVLHLLALCPRPLPPPCPILLMCAWCVQGGRRMMSSTAKERLQRKDGVARRGRTGRRTERKKSSLVYGVNALGASLLR